KENTRAEIGTNANVFANEDIHVNAFGSENILLAGTGLAVGLGFGATVGALTIDNQTTARVASNARLFANSDVVVLANDDTNTTLIAGAVFGGAAGLGASVGVMTVDKETVATIDNNAFVVARGYGTGIDSVLTGSKSPDGNTILRGTYSGLIVQSTSSENLDHFAVAAAGAGVTGLAGGVAVTIVDSNTLATIGASAIINLPSTTPSTAQVAYVNASNTIDGIAFAGALASGAVGASGAVNIASIRNDTLADVASGASLNAKNDVAINSLSIERLKGYTVGGASGAFGLAASVSVWSIGSALDKNYSNENRSGNSTPQSANALQGSGGPTAESDAARQAQESSLQFNQSLNNFDRDTSNPNQSSTKRVGGLTNLAATQIGAAAPTQASLQSKIDESGAVSGTTARISSGASVVAGDAIFVSSNAGLNFTQVTGAVAVGAVAVGAGVTVNTIASNSTAQVGGTLTSFGQGIFVTANNGQVTTVTGFAGAALGFVGLGAAVTTVTDRSVGQALVSDNAIVSTVGAFAVNSLDNRTLTANVASVAIGAIAAGAAFSKIKVANDNAIETQASIGNGAQINARRVDLNAKPVIVATANATGLAGGALVAASVNFAFVDAQNESRATIGASKVVSATEILINSQLVTTLKAKGTGVAVGVIGGAAGMMYADVSAGRGNNEDEVIAGISGAANIFATDLTIRADSTDTLLADSTAGVGGTIALAGSFARTTSDMATKSLIGDGATINILNLFGLYTVHEHTIDSFSDAVSVAGLSGQAALAASTNTGRANIAIGSNTTINTTQFRVTAANRIVKNKEDTSKPVADRFRDNIRSKSFALASLGILTSDNDIGTDADPFQAVITFGPGSKVKATSRPGQSAPALVEIYANTGFTTVDRVNVDAITLAGTISKGRSLMDVVTLSKVQLDGAQLENDSGSIGVNTLSKGSNIANGSLLVVGGFAGEASTSLRATTKSTNQIDVVNSTIKGLDVSLSSGKFGNDSAVDLNQLSNLTNARINTFSVLPLQGDDSFVSNLNVNNHLNFTGNSRIIGIRDVQLSVRNGTTTSENVGGIFSTQSGPVSHSVNGTRSLVQSNQVNIDNSAKVEAGAGSNMTYTIRPMRFEGATELTVDRLNTPLTPAEKTSRQLPQDVDFVFAPLTVGNITFTVETGYVIHLVNGAYAGGEANAYYKFLPGTSQIVPHLENYTNTSRWQKLTQSEMDGLSASDSPVYASDISQSFLAGLTGKYYIVKPSSTPLPTLSLRNIGNQLLNHRENVIGWMASHSGNAEAIARYEAQLLAIDAELEDLGLLDSIRVNSRRIVKKELDVLFIDLPRLNASPGSIFIYADGVDHNSFAGKVAGGQLVAHAEAKVDVKNASPFFLSTNGIKLHDARSLINNEVLQPGNVYANSVKLTNVSSTITKSVNIIQERLRPFSGYDFSGLPPFPSAISQDMYINDGVENENGTVYINNYEGSIYVSGEVNGQDPVQIIAANNLTINSDGWFHLADPRQYLNFLALDANAGGAGPDRQIYNSTSDVSDGTKTLAQAISGNMSRIVSQGRLALIARLLNLNGLVQSGADRVDMTITNAFVPPTQTITFSDLSDRNNNFKAQNKSNVEPRKPTAIPGVSFGSEDIPIAVTWDATNQRFLLGKIDPRGGEIIIAGQIMSTGGGKLKVASGYASVNIQNATPYPVVLDEVDTTKNRKGKITIIDTDPSRLLKTEYLVSGNEILEKNYLGTNVGTRTEYAPPTQTSHTFEESISYLPKPGLQYVWVEGQTLSELTSQTFRKKIFNLVGDNWLGDALVADSTAIGEPKIEPRGQPRPLLISETREAPGAGIPSYAVNKPYTLDYVRKEDAVISVVPNVTLVRHPPSSSTGTVYRYTGTVSKVIDISLVTYGTNSEWTNSGISAASFVPDPSNGRFESDNRQITYDPPYVSWGGFLN
ncbi:MAG: hypothetical protein ABL921_24875, partial [Pirellula sp.]